MVSSDVTFPANIVDDGMTACVDIPITDDDLIEGDQTFTVTVTLVTTDMNVMIGLPSTTTVTITDDNCKCFY